MEKLERRGDVDISMSKDEFDGLYEDLTHSAFERHERIQSCSNVINDTLKNLNQEITDLNNLINLDETSERVRDTLIISAKKGIRSINRLRARFKNCGNLIETNRNLSQLKNEFTIKKTDYLFKKFIEMKDAMIQMDSFGEDHINSLLVDHMSKKLKELIQERESLIADYLPFEKRRSEIDQLIHEDSVNEAYFSDEMSPETRQSLDVIKDNISQIRLLETELNTKIETVKRKQNERILAQENEETRRRNQTIAGYALVSLIALGCTYFDI
jgi:hypothetical protein